MDGHDWNDWKLTSLNGAGRRFWEHAAPQLSEPWQAARRFRVTGSVWHTIETLYPGESHDHLARSLCDPSVIDLDKLPPDALYGIHHEADAQAAYTLREPLREPPRDAGLCVPDPLDPAYDWVPRPRRFLLLHLGGSPDTICVPACDTTCESEAIPRIAEFKCPPSGILPGYVVDHHQPIPARHARQMLANSGITGARVCDYFVWTPQGTRNRECIFREAAYRQCVAGVLDFIGLHIITRQESQDLVLPPGAVDHYYRRSRADFIR